jgi:hypothetical protein
MFKVEKTFACQQRHFQDVGKYNFFYVSLRG